MSEPRATGSGGAFGLLIGVFLAVVLVVFALWAFAIIVAVLSIGPWAWRTWNERQPGQTGFYLRAWLAPRYHYPFVGIGSIVASVAGAVAILGFTISPILALPVLAAILARSLSMAWFPWPRSDAVGLRVYPLVALTGPLSASLGIIAVLALIWGGGLVNAGGSQHWAALDSGPLAIAFVLLAATVGRIGRTVMLGVAQNRVEVDDVLSLSAVEAARSQALSDNPFKTKSSAPVALALPNFRKVARQ